MLRHSTLPACPPLWVSVCLWVVAGGGGAGTLIVGDVGAYLLLCMWVLLFAVRRCWRVLDKHPH